MRLGDLGGDVKAEAQPFLMWFDGAAVKRFEQTSEGSFRYWLAAIQNGKFKVSIINNRRNTDGTCGIPMRHGVPQQIRKQLRNPRVINVDWGAKIELRFDEPFREARMHFGDHLIEGRLE